MALTTVGNYKAAARTLLQDTYAGSYRYPDADLVEALNLAMSEIARLRPDILFKQLRAGVPTYPNTDGETVDLDQRYAPSVVMFMTSWAQLRDQEEATDQRASALFSKFEQQLVSVKGS